MLRERIPETWHPFLRPFWQRWKHRPRYLRSQEIDRPVFIVGHPRSGTSWFYKLVATHPALAGGPESHLFDHFLRPFLEEDPFRPWGGLDYWLGPEKRPEVLRELVDNFFDYKLAEEQGRRIVEKTPEHALYVREIHELYPRSKFVHIVRDGRDVMLSVFAYAPNLQNPPADVEEAARQWCTTLARVEKAQQEHSADVVALRYEDLATDPEPNLNRVFEFIGERCSPSLVRQIVKDNPPSTKSIGKWREVLGEEDQNRFVAIAGSQLSEWNYET